MTDDGPSKASKNMEGAAFRGHTFRERGGRKQKTSINYAAELKPRFGLFPPPPPLSEQDLQRALRAHFATMLHPDDNGALAKAFRKLKIDPDDPADWRRLAEQLAQQRFRTRPKEAKLAAEINRAAHLLVEEKVIHDMAKEIAEQDGLVARKKLSRAAVARLLNSTLYKKRSQMRSPHYIENLLCHAHRLYETNKQLRDYLKKAGIIVVAERPRASRKKKTRSIG
jgi:hypothetical protein